MCWVLLEAINCGFFSCRVLDGWFQGCRHQGICREPPEKGSRRPLRQTAQPACRPSLFLMIIARPRSATGGLVTLIETHPRTRSGATLRRRQPPRCWTDSSCAVPVASATGDIAPAAGHPVAAAADPGFPDRTAARRPGGNDVRTQASSRGCSRHKRDACHVTRGKAPAICVPGDRQIHDNRDRRAASAYRQARTTMARLGASNCRC